MDKLVNVNQVFKRLHNISIFLNVYRKIDVVELDLIDSLHIETLIAKLDKFYMAYDFQNIIDFSIWCEVEKAASVDFKDLALRQIGKDVLTFLDYLFEYKED